MSDNRLPAHLEVAGLIRAVEVAGGFATVIAKGDRDAGVILILTTTRGGTAQLWERMPQADGRRHYIVSRHEDTDKKQEFADYLQRRIARDRDGWVVELDIANPERFVAELDR